MLSGAFTFSQNIWDKKNISDNISIIHIQYEVFLSLIFKRWTKVKGY